VAGDVADALDVGDRGAAELHHKAGHGGLADLFGKVSGENRVNGKPPRPKAVIHTGEVGRPQPAPF
jgi:hypothetical protein